MAPRKKPATANARGEVTIVLEGQEYHLRPSYEAIMAIEEQTGRTLFDLAQAANPSVQGLSLRECGILSAEMMKAFGRTHPEDPLASTYLQSTPESLSRLIHSEGPMKVQPRLYVALFAAVVGGVDVAGEFKPAGKKGSQPPSAG